MAQQPPAGVPPSPGPAGSPRGAGGGPSGPRAGFWIRFVAFVVDALILGVVGWLLGAVLGRGAGQLLQILVGIAYYTYLEGSPSGQTIGKRALSIRVINFGTGQPLGYGKAFIRYLGRFVSGLPLLLGYFWMLWDSEKQTWHDKIADTVVVPVDAYPVEKWPG